MADEVSIERSSSKDKPRLRGIASGLPAIKTARSDLERPNTNRSITFLGPGESIHAIYDIDDKALQSVSTRAVYPCTEKATGMDFILKIKRKRTKGSDEDLMLRSTLERMLNVEAEHLLTFQQVLEDDLHFYMVMTKCNSGELYQLLATADVLPERECKRIVREILTGIAQIHERGLIHRDIKPENVLMHRDDPCSPQSPKSMKIIDFDTTQAWTPESPKSKGVVGTHGYIAPEGYLGNYSPKSDLWSVGVIFYFLMTGEMPYSNTVYDCPDPEMDDNTIGRGIEKTYSRLEEATVDWESMPWPEFPVARDLCQQLLAFRPEDRVESAAAALQPPWLQSRRGTASNPGSPTVSPTKKSTANSSSTVSPTASPQMYGSTATESC
jgi:serine/threonine protein kinase